MDRLRQLVLVLVEREEVCCANDSSRGLMDNKMRGGDERC